MKPNFHRYWVKPAAVRVLASKILKNLVNNRLTDRHKKQGLFDKFQYGFRSFCSTSDHLTVLYDRSAWALIRSGTNQIVALMYPSLLAGFGALVFFTNSNLIIEFQAGCLAIFCHFSLKDDFGCF